MVVGIRNKEGEEEVAPTRNFGLGSTATSCLLTYCMICLSTMIKRQTRLVYCEENATQLIYSIPVTTLSYKAVMISTPLATKACSFMPVLRLPLISYKHPLPYVVSINAVSNKLYYPGSTKTSTSCARSCISPIIRSTELGGPLTGLSESLDPLGNKKPRRSLRRGAWDPAGAKETTIRSLVDLSILAAPD